MKKLYIYIFSILSLLIAVCSFKGGFILTGLVFFILGLFLIPSISNLASKKTGIPFQGKLKAITAFLLLFLGVYLSIIAGTKLVEEKNIRADKLLGEADSIILLGLSDQAMERILDAKSLYSNKLRKNAKLHESELLNYQSEKYLRNILLRMSDSVYKELKERNLHSQYFQTVSINTAFLNKLYENREMRAKLIEEKKEKERIAKIEAEKRRKEAEKKAREEAKAKKEAERLARKMMETVLRNNFLDAGFDIKVKVSGKNYDRLTLTFVLFNDVWTRKLQTEGLISQWFQMGFKRIDIKDGYDYHKYFSVR